MASAGTGTVDGTGEYIFDASSDGGNCTTFKVACDAGSSVALDVNVNALHKSGEYFRIPVGKEEVFRAGSNAISKVYAKGVSGTATIRYGVLAKL